jgi:hypothetical protein
VNRAARYAQNEVATLERFNNRVAESEKEVDDVLTKFLNVSEDFKTEVTTFKKDAINLAESKKPHPSDKHYELKKEGYKLLLNHSAQAIEKVEDAYDKTFTKVKSRFQRIKSWLVEKASQAYNAVKNTFKSAWRTFKSWFS